MQDTAQAARAGLVQALKSLRAILARGPEEILPARVRLCDPLKDPGDGPDRESFLRFDEARRAIEAFGKIILGGNERGGCFNTTIAPAGILESLHLFILQDVGQLDRLPAPWVLPELDQWIERFGGKQPRASAAVFDGNNLTLTLNGKPLSLSSGEKYVLSKLVEMRAATITELRTQNPHPDRILKELREKYPPLKKFISLPGGPGKGGYSTTIEPSQADGHK